MRIRASMSAWCAAQDIGVRCMALTTTESTARARSATAMFAGMPGDLIGGGELVLLAIKPSLWRPVFDSCLWLCAAAIGTTAIVLTGTALPGLSGTATAQAVMLAGLIRLAWSVASWLPTWHILTNRRVLTASGVWSPRISSIALAELRSVQIRRSNWDGMARTGSIEFDPAPGGEKAPTWRTVSQPDVIHGKIVRAMGPLGDEGRSGA